MGSIENKTLKNGSIVTYPRIDGERDENDATHWRWGFNWEEKVNGEWRNRSLGCIPHRVLSMIRAMQKLDTPLDKTIEFIKNSKGKKRA